MIDKISPTTVTGIDTTVKSEKTAETNETDSTATVQSQALAQALVSGKLSSEYSGNYLKARDFQSNISFSQQRISALKTVNSYLEQLKGLAIQYVSSKKDLSLSQQDSIVAQAETALYSIDQTAASAQFMGSKVISDASSQDLGLTVINLEAGDPVAQISSAMSAVGAKMSVTAGQIHMSDNRLAYMQTANETSNGKMSEFEAMQLAKSLFIADDIQQTDVLYSNKLNTDKVNGLLGR